MKITYLLSPRGRQGVQGGLRRAVDRQVVHPELRSGRCDVDDPTSGWHMRNGSLCDEDGPLDVDVEDTLDVLRLVVKGPGEPTSPGVIDYKSIVRFYACL